MLCAISFQVHDACMCSSDAMFFKSVSCLSFYFHHNNLFFSRSLSFVLANGAMAYALLAFCYFTIDNKRWWDGTPFIFPGTVLSMLALVAVFKR